MARENPGECDCCGYVTKRLRLLEQANTTIAGGGRMRQDDFWFCDLCSSTPAGNAHLFPTQYTDGSSMRTICYVGNVLLAELRKRPREKKS